MNYSCVNTQIYGVQYCEGHPRSGMIDYYRADVLIRTEYRIGHPKHGIVITYDAAESEQIAQRSEPSPQLRKQIVKYVDKTVVHE